MPSGGKSLTGMLLLNVCYHPLWFPRVSQFLLLYLSKSKVLGVGVDPEGLRQSLGGHISNKFPWNTDAVVRSVPFERQYSNWVFKGSFLKLSRYIPFLHSLL